MCSSDLSGKHAHYSPESFPLVLVICGRAANIIYPDDFNAKSYKITLGLKDKQHNAFGMPLWKFTLDGEKHLSPCNTAVFTRDDFHELLDSLNMDEIDKITIIDIKEVFKKERGSSEDDSFTSRSEEHTSELQSHSFISYAVFCLKKKNTTE